MSQVLGMRGTGSFDVTGQRPESWELGIITEYGDIAPLTAVLGMLRGGKTANDHHFHWFEEYYPTKRLRINNGAGYLVGDTTLTVDTENTDTPVSGAYGTVAGSVLWNERTGERMLVAEDPTSDTAIKVRRAFGSTAAAAINDDDWLTVLASSYAEGDDVPTAIGYKPTEINNVTQIMRKAISVTGSADETDFRTGAAYADAARKALRDFLIEKERSYIFGEYSLTTNSDGQRISATRGIISHIESYCAANVVSNGGAISESTWDEYMEIVFRNGSQNKLALCGGTALRTLSSLAKGGNIRMQDTPRSSSYGMKLTELITTFGSLQLKLHPQFARHSLLTNNILIIDTEHVQEMKHKGARGNMKILKDRQSPGVDGRTDEYFQEAGLKTTIGSAHMYIKDVTSFAP